MKNFKKYDVVIAGAGPAGLSLAALLAPTGLAIALVEKQSAAALAKPAYDGREVALTHLSKTIMEEAGLWRRIPKRDISIIKDAKVVNGSSPYVLHFSHREAGKKNLGFMVSNHLIRKAAFEAVLSFKNVTLIDRTEVIKAKTDNAVAEVRLSDGSVLRAKLLVAADSRFSAVRRMLGVEARMHDFKRLCIVSRMSHARPHADTAHECFFDDLTLAVLPLNRRHASIVLTVDEKRGQEILKMTGPTFSRFIEEHIGKRLGRMKLVSALHSYPLVATYAESFHGKRFALLGDAAVGMHPVTAHGFNFGLRGAHDLAQRIAKGIASGMDPGSPAALAGYARQHRLATRPLYLGTNAIVNLFTNKGKTAMAARHALLRIGNRFPPAKKAIMQSLTESSRAAG